MRINEKYKEKRKKSRAIFLSHAQQIPFYICAFLCEWIYLLKAIVQPFKAGTYKVEMATWEWNVVLAIGVIIITVWIFNVFSRVDIREIKNIWEEVKLNEIRMHSR